MGSSFTWFMQSDALDDDSDKTGMYKELYLKDCVDLGFRPVTFEPDLFDMYYVSSLNTLKLKMSKREIINNPSNNDR